MGPNLASFQVDALTLGLLRGAETHLVRATGPTSPRVLPLFGDSRTKTVTCQDSAEDHSQSFDSGGPKLSEKFQVDRGNVLQEHAKTHNRRKGYFDQLFIHRSAHLGRSLQQMRLNISVFRLVVSCSSGQGCASQSFFLSN